MDYVELFRSFPAPVATLLIAMLPIAELRVSLPLALAVYKLSLFQALTFSIVGNMLPVIFLLLLFDPLSRYLMEKSKFFHSFFQWIFTRTRKNFNGQYLKYGEWALVVFVGIPLPLTGAWTGAVAAFLFGIPPKRACFLIFLGVCLAGIIVSFLSFGAFKIFI